MVTKNFLSMLVLVFLSTALLTACGNNNNNVIIPPATPEAALLATGGTSTSGSGGAGGSVYLESYGGAVKVLKSGTVDAVFTVPAFIPDFGSISAIVSGGTITVLDTDTTPDNLCQVSGGDGSLYVGDGNGTCGEGLDTLVTGLTVDPGATLVLLDQGSGYGTLRLTNDLVINGTLTTDVNATWGLDIEANIIDVESGGMITSSATTMDLGAGEIWLGNGSGTTQIINRGTIEAKGLGSGSGGYMCFEPADLVVNTGTIDASGGNSTVAGSGGGSGGSGGELDVYVDYGDFYSSGIMRMNGGKGDTDGGDTEADYYIYDGYSVYVETAYYGNTRDRNGDIIISGTWEANGGDGTNGRGGYGGYIYLQTDALGAVTINAGMSAKGGDALAAGFSGGNAWYGYGIEIYSYLDPYGSGSFNDPATPGKISIAGKYDLRGGSGDEMGGYGGYFDIYSEGYNASEIGSDVELVGFAAIDLNGGEGDSGGSASGQAFEIHTYSAGATPAGPITNDARIEARGGKATGAGSTGGAGGYLEMIASGTGDPAEVINNSGTIDISGGAGDTGGEAYGGGSWDALYLEAIHITNSGALTANGGNGTTAGGNGGNITLYSTDYTTTPTMNTGTLSAAGGTGTAAGTPGTITIDGGGPI